MNFYLAGSGSGSVSQRYGSAVPDPESYQNVADPEYCLQHEYVGRFFPAYQKPCCVDTAEIRLMTKDGVFQQ
jgi:hypothetical protein